MDKEKYTDMHVNLDNKKNMEKTYVVQNSRAEI